ncbi:aminopeptidase [Deinococcus sp. KNUC1210]|uniref:aminopeptidase n=1 Tax=Deinococcus sp. KNUC1210 TaxID=2917691 RepID=UPI001EF0F2E9|nr:aminopeptidase [Deinococcus sp. KNUC1210]ULH15639.1 aminopeptidase [Deinococcus sp. KNUC1210]
MPTNRLPAARSFRWIGLGVLLAGSLLALSGCSQISYLWQAAAGQSELLTRARPIPDVIADPATPAELRRQLTLIQDVRRYASETLGLPDNATFTGYSDLKRPFLVWNVFAAPPLSGTLRTYCFPIAGCVPYRGYFSQAAADSEAARLRAQGDDVSVGGVSAYSTLGRFSDPIPSTLLRGGDETLIRTVIHELAHQVVYVQNDTAFNESFAVAVETAGAQRYAAARGLPVPDQTVARTRAAQINELLLGTRTRLAELYASGLPDAQKRTRKADILNETRQQYADLKASWNGYSGYDGWFADTPNGLNNALLGSVAAYADHVPAFLALLARHGGDFPAFYTAVKGCAALPQSERLACLDPAP